MDDLGPPIDIIFSLGVPDMHVRLGYRIKLVDFEPSMSLGYTLFLVVCPFLLAKLAELSRWLVTGILKFNVGYNITSIWILSRNNY